MVEGPVGFALGLDGVGIAGEEPAGDRGAIDHGDHAVYRDPGADLRPAKGLDQGLGQGEPGSLDDDMVRRIGPIQEALNGRDEVVGDRAADAAVGQFQDVVLGAARDAAALENFAVHAEVAELVDDQGQALAAGVLQEVPDSRGLAGAEEAGDDGRGDLSVPRHSPGPPAQGFPARRGALP